MEPVRALQLYEINYEICRHVKSEGGDEAWRRDLARLARCSVAFTAPALDVLWWEVDTVKAVFRLAEIIQEQIQTGREGQSSYLSHWARFHEYAKRIRVLNVAGGDVPPTFALPGWETEPVFPRLHTVEWSGQWPELARKLFLSSSLRCLRVTMPYGNRTVRSSLMWRDFAIALVLVAPQLRELVFERIRAHIYVSFVAKFPQLQCLKFYAFPPVSSDLLRELSRLEHLAHLKARLGGRSPDSIMGWTGYPALRVLDLSDPPIPLVCQLLDQLTTPNLESFQAHIGGVWSGDWSNVQMCTSKLASRWTSSLTAVKIASRSYNHDPAPGTVIGGLHALLPLTDTKRLTSLHIAIKNVTLAMDDDDFMRLVSAWPQMQSLTICRIRGITFRCLPSVVHHCSALSHLGLGDVDVCTIPDLESFPISCHRLSKLVVEYSHRVLDDDKMEEIFEIVYRCFPFLSPAVTLVDGSIWN